MQLLLLLFVAHLSFASQERRLDISHLTSPNQEALLVYETKEDFSEQVRLLGVHLLVGDRVFFPAINLSGYLDEVVGTQICIYFGYAKGVLGPTLPQGSVMTFSMDREGKVSSLRGTTRGRSYGGLGTDTVICERRRPE